MLSVSSMTLLFLCKEKWAIPRTGVFFVQCDSSKFCKYSFNERELNSYYMADFVLFMFAHIISLDLIFRDKGFKG